MIDLARHIESLLLENDCVIIPGLGGFVTHYTPAEWVEDEHLFLPPSRKVGFNPQLKLNDGLLVQSYMAVYGTNFPEANKQIEQETKRLIQMLHEDGKVDLPNVGELHCTIHGKYDFTPFDQKLATPSLYGLDCFEMHKLADLHAMDSARQVYPAEEVSLPEKEEKEKRQAGIPATTEQPQEIQRAARRIVRLHPYRWAGIAAMIAVIFLSFFFSAPIENTEVPDRNYACLSLEELFNEIGTQQLPVTPVPVRKPEAAAASRPAKVEQVETAKTSSEAPAAAPETQKEAPVAVQQPANRPEAAPAAEKPQSQTNTTRRARRFHVIVASVGTQADGEKMARQLLDKGHAQAAVIAGDGKVRVSLESFGTEREAYQRINQLRITDSFPGAWVLRK